MEDNGKSATGLLAYKMGEKPVLFKAIQPAGEFIKNNKDALHEILSKEWNAIILHTRQPTDGENSYENAQPLRNNKGILAHNGVVGNVDELCKLFNLKKNEKASDTWHLARCMEQYPLKAFSEATGTIRALYLEPKTNELLILSNSTTGLDLLYDKNEKTFMCANFKTILDSYYKKYNYYFGGLFKEETPESECTNSTVKEELGSDEVIHIDFAEKKVQKFDCKTAGGYTAYNSANITNYNRGYYD